MKIVARLVVMFCFFQKNYNRDEIALIRRCHVQGNLQSFDSNSKRPLDYLLLLHEQVFNCKARQAFICFYVIVLLLMKLLDHH